jgi:hypothetical protein
MAYQGISTGSAPNDGTGDNLLSGAIKINSNFQEIYSAIGNGTNLNFLSPLQSNIPNAVVAGTNITKTSVAGGVQINAAEPSLNSSANGSNVNINLSGTSALDTIIVTAGNNITVGSVSSTGFTINSAEPTLTSSSNGSNVDINLGGIDTPNTLTVTAGDYVTIDSVSSSGFTINANVGFSTVVTIVSGETRGLNLSEDNGLFILEGPSSTASLSNLFPVGTKFTIISKDPTNVLNRSNGTLIMGINENMTLNSNYSAIDVIWTGPTFGWAIK